MYPDGSAYSAMHACIIPILFLYKKKHFFLQLQDSHVLLLRQLFWFTIDHMVHSSCLKNTEKPWQQQME